MIMFSLLVMRVKEPIVLSEITFTHKDGWMDVYKHFSLQSLF